MLSMTGYGRGRCSADGRELLLELKTVNHRFLDVSFRLPKTLTFLEEPLRGKITDGELRRGHVELTVTYQNSRPDANTVTLDEPLLMQCAARTGAIAQELHMTTPTMGELMALCGALKVTQTEEDAEAVTALALLAYGEAEAQLLRMRISEGQTLAGDLTANLSAAKALCESIAKRAPTVPEAYRERLTAKLREWGLQATEPQRIAQEVALLADRCAIDEELSRLGSHFQQFQACLTADDEVGRRMDFLLQEMNRETNTIGSKALDADIAQRVVEIKCLLEKLREQVQNVV